MNRDQTITALMDAALITDPAEKKQRMKAILVEFESYLGIPPPKSQDHSELFHCFSTNGKKSTPDSTPTGGRQRKVPPEVIPIIRSMNAGTDGYLEKRGYRQIAAYMRQNHGLHVDWTTIRNIVKRRGVYAEG